MVAVVETDKVTMDIRAKQRGLFLAGFVEAGAEVAVGADLYQLDTAVEAAGAVTEASPSAVVAPAPPAEVASIAAAATVPSVLEVKVPIMGESITTGMLAAWLKNTGENYCALHSSCPVGGAYARGV